MDQDLGTFLDKKIFCKKKKEMCKVKINFKCGKIICKKEMSKVKLNFKCGRLFSV